MNLISKWILFYFNICYLILDYFVNFLAYYF